MENFLQALILAFMLEGICFALFPGQMRKAMEEASSMNDQSLRALGGMALAVALFLGLVLRLVH